jgi:hypothetical protein
VDLSDAYTDGIGEWDKVAIAFGYQHFPVGTDEPKALDAILRGAHGKGLRFLSDDEARDPAGSSPVANLWDNGKNAVDELQRVMALRKAALDRYSPAAIRMGAPMSDLANTLVPVFLMHRYQTEAAAKTLGGVDYNYALRGDNQAVTAIVPAAEQLRALDGLLKTLNPAALEVPEALLTQIPPIAYGYDETREQFKGRTGKTFDPVAAAESSAHHTLGLLLHAERAARLDHLKARDAAQPGFDGVLKHLLAATWSAAPQRGMRGEIQKAVNMAALHHLMALAANEAAAPSARAQAHAALVALRKDLGARRSADPTWAAIHQFAAAQIERFEKDPKVIPIPRPLEPPAGQPIGCLME